MEELTNPSVKGEVMFAILTGDIRSSGSCVVRLDLSTAALLTTANITAKLTVVNDHMMLAWFSGSQSC